ncbi:MAG: 50S ribosomal protein L9 [Sedimentisphaerales bacterium]|nr:50S ribosomal protein L9 [Sedimentisphaerales bacterium]
MKVLLHVDVPKLGFLGDIVEVKDGYARNCLLPQRMAVQPTEANIKAIAEEKARQAEVRRLAKEELVRAAKAVDGANVTIVANVNEQGHLFGSVAEAEIAKALQEQGFSVQPKHVKLPEHLRQLGEYEVVLSFGADVKANVNLAIVSEGQNGVEEPGTESESEPESSAAEDNTDE